MIAADGSGTVPRDQDRLPGWMGCSAFCCKQALTPMFGSSPSSAGSPRTSFGSVAGETTFCVKRALPKLKVAADWRAPVERNRYEMAWMRVAAGIVPKAGPRCWARMPRRGRLPWRGCRRSATPSGRRSWRDGILDRRMAGAVGDVLGRIHAGDRGRQRRSPHGFPPATLFHAIRLEPYLVATARAHPALAARLPTSSSDTAAHQAGPRSRRLQPEEPAERAGRPGDARCRMCVVRRSRLRPGVRAQSPAAQGGLEAALAQRLPAPVRDAWSGLTARTSRWEPWEALDARTAALLPGLCSAASTASRPSST